MWNWIMIETALPFCSSALLEFSVYRLKRLKGLEHETYIDACGVFTGREREETAMRGREQILVL
jgi:hypothetical protein